MAGLLWFQALPVLSAAFTAHVALRILLDEAVPTLQIKQYIVTQLFAKPAIPPAALSVGDWGIHNMYN